MGQYQADLDIAEGHAKGRAYERIAILEILARATSVRDCFHVNGTTMKNAAGNDLFIDAAKIDAAIAEIKARS